MSNISFEIRSLILQLLGAGPILALLVGGIGACFVWTRRPLRVRTAICFAVAWETAAFFGVSHVYEFSMTLFDTAGTQSTRMLCGSWVCSAVYALPVAVLLWATFTRDDPGIG